MLTGHPLIQPVGNLDILKLVSMIIKINIYLITQTYSQVSECEISQEY